jgi:rhodanese-related sulfurtransferase
MLRNNQLNFATILAREFRQKVLSKSENEIILDIRTVQEFEAGEFQAQLTLIFTVTTFKKN